MYLVTEFWTNGDVTYEFYNDPYRIGPTYTRQELEAKYAHDPRFTKISIKQIHVR